MPIYRGGVQNELALDTLFSNTELFNCIVLSFDGPERISLARLAQEKYQQSFSNLVLLVTAKEMTAVEHFSWILRQPPISQLAMETPMTLLAEDDLIESDALARAFRLAITEPRSIVFGAWAPIGTKNEVLPCAAEPILIPGQEMFSWLRNYERNFETSISTLTVEKKVWISYSNFFEDSWQQDPSGVRAEYFLANNPLVSHLVHSPAPLARLQRSSEQESKLIKSRQWWTDEVVYLLWLLFEGRPLTALQKAETCMRLARNLLIRPLDFGNLIAALKVLNRRRRLPLRKVVLSQTERGRATARAKKANQAG